MTTEQNPSDPTRATATGRLHVSLQVADIGTWEPGRQLIRWADPCRALLGAEGGNAAPYTQLLALVDPSDRERVGAALPLPLSGRLHDQCDIRFCVSEGGVGKVTVRNGMGNPTTIRSRTDLRHGQYGPWGVVLRCSLPAHLLMKMILVATNFSENSVWVPDYALELADQLHTRLVIVQAYDPNPSDGQESGFIAWGTNQQYTIAMRQLSRLRTRMITATKGRVNVSVVTLPGEPATCLDEEAVRQGADLLIMGLAGDDPQKARKLGSLATRLIPRTSVPMLLVPPGAHYQAVQNIALAVDLSRPMAALALAGAKRFAQLSGATLDISCMANEPDAQLHKAAGGICTFLSDQPHTFSFLPGDDLTVVLDTYFMAYRADLIMLLPKPHNRLQTFRRESVTQQVARRATTPVLAVV